MAKKCKWEYIKYWWNRALEKDMWQNLDDNNVKPYRSLEDAGLDSWELVQVIEQKDNLMVYFFKREFDR